MTDFDLISTMPSAATTCSAVKTVKRPANGWNACPALLSCRLRGNKLNRKTKTELSGAIPWTGASRPLQTPQCSLLAWMTWPLLAWCQMSYTFTCLFIYLSRALSQPLAWPAVWECAGCSLLSWMIYWKPACVWIVFQRYKQTGSTAFWLSWLGQKWGRSSN